MIMKFPKTLRMAILRWLGAGVVVAATTACGTDAPPLSAEHGSYLRTVKGSVPLECPICPVAIAKQAVGEAVAPQCTEHCENCGNGICDLDEAWESCSSDCPREFPPGGPGGCGNGICSPNEVDWCARDCGPIDPTPLQRQPRNRVPPECGNGTCDPEELITCPQDCVPVPDLR